MKQTELRWSRDGTPFFARIWREESDPRALVVILHGLGDHSGRYQPLVDELIAAGYAVAAADMRGHGQSGGKRGDIPGFDALVEDVDSFLDQLHEHFPGLDRVLYGHSMGGALALYYAWKRPAREGVRAVVLSGPAFAPAFDPPAWKLTLAGWLEHVWPSLTLGSGIDAEDISRDSDTVERYRNDSLVHDQISVRFYNEWRKAMEGVRAAGPPPFPTLLLHGEADRLTSAAASRAYAERAGDRVTCHLLKGLFHELHHEPERGEVFALVLEWLGDRLEERWTPQPKGAGIRDDR